MRNMTTISNMIMMLLLFLLRSQLIGSNRFESVYADSNSFNSIQIQFDSHNSRCDGV